MLLRDLTIENYRSFDKYKLDGLARVNLLVGDNNCGKTSVLEAVRLLTSLGDIAVLIDTLELREDMTFASAADAEGIKEHYGGSSLFYGGDSAQDYADLEPISFSTATGNLRRVLLSVVQQSGTGPAELMVDVDYNGKEAHVGSIEIDGFGRISGPWSGPTAWHLSAESKSSPHFYIAPGGMTTFAMAMCWRQLLKLKRESIPHEAMRIIHPLIERIQFSPDTQHRRDIFVDLNGERLSVAQLGGGSSALLSLGIGLASVKGGTLLADEIDTGLHYSRLPDMWRMVVKTAQELDVQVFATTHSLDCIRGLAYAVAADESLTDDVAIFRIDRRMDHAVRFGGDELEVVAEHEIEVR